MLLNGLMHGDEFCAIRKRGFDLNIGNHLCNAVHHIGFGEHVAAFAHELGDCFAIARAFHHGSADEANSFRVIELQATRFAAFGQQGGCEDKKLVFFSGCQFHDAQRLDVS
jgi:hypothetical protein